MTEEMKPVDFGMFLVLWNQRQNMKTPLLHIRIGQWLEERHNEGDKRLLLMAFRSAGKSTLVGVFAAWLLYRNPALRILVLAADSVLAEKMVRNVRRIIERHPLTGALKPKNADQWASDRFTVARKTEMRDPSMMARGVGSNITGSRADIVICDDVEVPNTCDSEDKRQDLRERLGEMNYVLASEGMQIYVGTPHHYFSIYADVPRTEVGEDRTFLDGFKRLCIPVTDEDGNSAWPEKFTIEAIEQIKASTGPNKFDSQMMLKAVNILDSRLDVDLLQFYNSEIEYARELDTLFLGHQKITRRAAFWDPSVANGKGDNSVIAVVYGDTGGNFYLHHMKYIKVNPHAPESGMEQQCKIAAQIAKDFHLTHMKVEDNGLGKFLPDALRQQMSIISPATSVTKVTNRKNKVQRIIEGFDAVLAARRLYVHQSVCHTPFIREMREWKGDGKGRDDGLDAVAGALEQHPSKGNDGRGGRVYEVKNSVKI